MSLGKDKYILNTDRQTRRDATRGAAHAQSNASAVKKSESGSLKISGNIYKNGEHFDLFMNLYMPQTVFVPYRPIPNRYVSHLINVDHFRSFLPLFGKCGNFHVVPPLRF